MFANGFLFLLIILPNVLSEFLLWPCREEKKRKRSQRHLTRPTDFERHNVAVSTERTKRWQQICVTDSKWPIKNLSRRWFERLIFIVIDLNRMRISQIIQHRFECGKRAIKQAIKIAHVRWMLWIVLLFLGLHRLWSIRCASIHCAKVLVPKKCTWYENWFFSFLLRNEGKKNHER